MKRFLVLEDFSSAEDAIDQAAPALMPVSETDDAEPLASYEAGYKNGWADCAVAEAEERKSIGAHLATKLREAQLTYETARGDILDALSPFFQELVATMLPRLAAEALGPIVVNELLSILEYEVGAEIEILAAPGACERLQHVMDSEGIEGAHVRAEPAFSESQVSLRVRSERRDINLSEVTEKIAEAIHAFQSQSHTPSFSQGAA